jgi:hypothetical protein
MKKLMFNLAGILFLLWFLDLNSKTIMFGLVAYGIFKYRAKIKSSLGLLKVFSLIKKGIVCIFKGIKFVYFALVIAKAKRLFGIKGSLLEVLKTAKIYSDHINLIRGNITYSYTYGKKRRMLFGSIKKAFGSVSNSFGHIKKVSLEMKPLIKQL